jgi:hypothetical protein
MRTGRQFHIIVVTAILMSIFLFLQSSWRDFEFSARRPDEEPSIPGAKVDKPGSHNGEERHKGTKEGKQEIPHSDEPPQPTRKPEPSHSAPSNVSTHDRVVVIGRLGNEDTSWVGENLPDWQHAVYVVDDPNSPGLHTSMNKGREAMPYLTYLVEHYHNLPATIVFLHAHRSGYPVAWHNEGEDHDAVRMVRSLNTDFIQRSGYANLRCVHIPGCPDEV